MKKKIEWFSNKPLRVIKPRETNKLVRTGVNVALGLTALGFGLAALKSVKE